METLDRKRRPATSWFSFRPLPPQTVTVLTNGVRLHEIDNGTMPVNRLSLVIGYGRNAAFRMGCADSAAIMSELLTEGTLTRSGSDIARDVDYEGAFLRAAISDSYTTIDLVGLNSATPRLTPILTDIFHNASFPEETLNAVRARLAQSYEVESTRPPVVAGRRLSAIMAGPGHPNSRKRSAETIMAVSREQVIDQYRRMRDGATLDVYLAGKLDDALRAEVRNFCLSLRDAAPAAADAFEPVFIPFEPEAEGRCDIVMADSMQTAIAAGIPAIGRDHPDYINLRLTVMALGGYFGSRLMTNIREEKGLTYGINASLMGNHDGAYVCIAAQCPAGTASPVLTEIGREMTALATVDMDADELTRLRQYAFSQLVSALDSPFAIQDCYRNILMLGTPADYFRMQFDAISALDAATIRRMAATYLRPELLREVTAGPMV